MYPSVVPWDLNRLQLLEDNPVLICLFSAVILIPNAAIYRAFNVNFDVVWHSVLLVEFFECNGLTSKRVFFQTSDAYPAACAYLDRHFMSFGIVSLPHATNMQMS